MAPAACGLLLRLWNVADQLLGGDELHAVDTALALPFGEILVTYQAQDHSIPLTAFYRLLLDAGIPLSEMALRAPILAAGLAALVLLPLAVGRALGRPTAVAFAWLLAISPFLVLYSRIVRSYAPVVLLGSAAAIAFWAWLVEAAGGKGRLLAALYAACAALATYFHLVAAPFVLAPLAYACCEKLLAPRLAGRSWKGLLGIGASTALAFAAFAVPARETLVPLVLRKARKTSFDLESLTGSLQIFAGSTSLLAVALFWLAAAAGLGLLLARRRRLGAYTATLGAVPLAALLYLAPRASERPEHIGRFLLVALPVVLLWVASALGHSWWAGRRSGAGPRRLRLAASAGVIALLAATSPFADPAVRAGSLVHHRDFLAFHEPRATMDPADVPAFFRRLAEEDEGTGRSAALLHYPWYPPWRLSTAPYVYQQIHGRPILGSAPQSFLNDRRLAWRGFVRPSPDSFLASRARYLVVHRDAAAEEGRIESHRKELTGAWQNEDKKWSGLRREGPTMALRLEALWGPPDFADETILVWDLDRVRAPKDSHDRGLR